MKGLAAELDPATEKLRPGQPRPLFSTGMSGEFTDYVNDCLNRIALASKRPAPIPKNVIDGSKILFTLSLGPAGNVESINIIKNDGGTDLEIFLREAIRRSTPFPPFPDAMAKKYNKVVITRTILFKN